MSLDLAPLENALTELEAFLELRDSEPRSPAELSVQQRAVQAGVIQAFEFSFELCHKMLRRYLEITTPSNTEIRQLGFADLIRIGYDRNLVKAEWEVWAAIRNMRNMTSHTYDRNKAATVLSAVPEFLSEARYLLAAMQARPAT